MRLIPLKLDCLQANKYTDYGAGTNIDRSTSRRRASKFDPLHLLQLGANGWLDQLQIIACCGRKAFKQCPVGIFPDIGREVEFEWINLGGGRKPLFYIIYHSKLLPLYFNFIQQMISRPPPEVSVVARGERLRGWDKIAWIFINFCHVKLLGYTNKMRKLSYPTPWTAPPVVSRLRNWWSRRYASTLCAIWQRDGRSSARPRNQSPIEREWYCSAHRVCAIRQWADCLPFSRRRSFCHRTWRQRFYAPESADWRMPMGCSKGCWEMKSHSFCK